ncbi:MAG: hypothetical protein JXB07_08350 [Anaerolineae bacterium]|nr:hypothetical protein [Anaerolineae bacterium]
MYHRTRLPIALCIAIGMVLAACAAGGAATTTSVPTIAASSPGASATPRAEASSTVPPPTLTPYPAASTPLPPTPLPLPSLDEGTAPSGAIARLGIGSIHATALSPDGQLLAVGTTTGVYVYNANTFKRQWDKPIEASVKGIAWSPDGKLVAVWFVQSSIVKVLDAQTGTQQHYLEQSGHIGDVDWSPDSTRLAVGWSGNLICYWEMPPDALDPRISVWDVTRSELLFTSEVLFEDDYWTPPVRDVRWSPDSNIIAMTTSVSRPGDEGTIDKFNVAILWDAQTGSQMRILEHWLLQYVAFSPDGKMLATWTTDNGTDAPRGSSNVWLWNVTTGELIYLLEGHTRNVYAVAWSPDGTRLASGAWGDSYAETIIWDTQTGTSLMKLLAGDESEQVTTLDWSPDGRYLATGILFSWPFSGIIVWDTSNGEQVLESLDHVGWVKMVAWAHDSQHLITSSSNAVFMRNLQRPEPLLAIHGIESYIEIRNLTWLSNTSLVATNAYNTVVEWDIPSKRPTHISDGADITWAPESTETSPDGTLRAEVILTPVEIGYSERHLSKVIVKDASEAILHEFDGPQADHLLVKWSPDGKHLAVAGGLDAACKIDPFAEGWEENAVMVWDITTGDLLHTFLGHTGRVFSLAWSPDGHMLASGSADGTVIVWDVH